MEIRMMISLFKKLLSKNKKCRNKNSSFKKSYVTFVNENTPLTQKVIKYLDDNYQPISSKPSCQFDCADEWSSDYAQIFIEKNNFIDDDGNNTKVHIDQSLIIRSTLDQ